MQSCTPTTSRHGTRNGASAWYGEKKTPGLIVCNRRFRSLMSYGRPIGDDVDSIFT